MPKLTAATRYLKEQLSASGIEMLLSDECLMELALDAIKAACGTQEQGETYIACVRRHLEERARFVALWTSTDAACDQAVWRDLVEIARKHALPRPSSSHTNFPAGR